MLTVLSRTCRKIANKLIEERQPSFRVNERKRLTTTARAPEGWSNGFGFAVDFAKMLKIRNIVQGSGFSLVVAHRVGPFFAAVVLSLVLLSNPAESQRTRIKPVKVSGQTQTFEIPSWGNEVPSLLMELPTGFVLARSKGVDFDTYVVSAKSPTWGARMGIYVGHHPDDTWPQTASKEPGVVGPIPITWHVWNASDNGQTLYHRDALIENFFSEPRQEVAPTRQMLSEHRPPVSPPAPPDPGDGLAIHIYISGNSSEAAKTMAAWVSTLRKKP